MSFSEMLRKAVTIGGQALEEGDEALLERLGDEVSGIATEIETLFADWDDPPAGIEEMVNDLDQAYLRAGEIYLEVCELIAEAIEQRQRAKLQEALDVLDEATEALGEAESLMRSRLFEKSP